MTHVQDFSWLENYEHSSSKNQSVKWESQKERKKERIFIKNQHFKEKIVLKLKINELSLLTTSIVQVFEWWIKFGWKKSHYTYYVSTGKIDNFCMFFPLILMLKFTVYEKRFIHATVKDKKILIICHSVQWYLFLFQFKL